MVVLRVMRVIRVVFRAASVATNHGCGVEHRGGLVEVVLDPELAV